MYNSDAVFSEHLPAGVSSIESPEMGHARRFGALELDFLTCGAPQKWYVDVTRQRLRFTVRYVVRFLSLDPECNGVPFSETRCARHVQGSDDPFVKRRASCPMCTVIGMPLMRRDRMKN